MSLMSIKELRLVVDEEELVLVLLLAHGVWTKTNAYSEPPRFLGCHLFIYMLDYIYVNDFVYYFSESDKVEEWFVNNLKSHVKVDFMDDVQ